MAEKVQVVCVGQAVVDCITNGWEENQYRKNVYRARSITLNVGGDAFNESVILTRLGHCVRLVCCLGQDMAGDLIVSQIRAAGVSDEGITRLACETTPVADILINPGKERQSVTSAAATLKSYRPSLDNISGYKVLSLASMFRAPLDDTDRILSLVRGAKAQGVIVCADTKMPTFKDFCLEDVKEILPYIDYIFPNENEAAFFTGRSDFNDMAQVFLDMGVGHVVVKTGAAGCVARSGSESFALPAFPVKAVDTTGAGDNFVAGFISTLLSGGSFYDCCVFASATAANSVMALGTTAGVRSRGQIELFLKNQK